MVTHIKHPAHITIPWSFFVRTQQSNTWILFNINSRHYINSSYYCYSNFRIAFLKWHQSKFIIPKSLYYITIWHLLTCFFQCYFKTHMWSKILPGIYKNWHEQGYLKIWKTQKRESEHDRVHIQTCLWRILRGDSVKNSHDAFHPRGSRPDTVCGHLCDNFDRHLFFFSHSGFLSVSISCMLSFASTSIVWGHFIDTQYLLPGLETYYQLVSVLHYAIFLTGKN